MNFFILHLRVLMRKTSIEDFGMIALYPYCMTNTQLFLKAKRTWKYHQILHSQRSISSLVKISKSYCFYCHIFTQRNLIIVHNQSQCVRK